MPVNGPETISDSKPSQPVSSEGRSVRAARNAKPAVGRGASTRRRRNRQDSSETNGEERFFLARANRNGDVPTLGRECPTEAEAIIEAFREKVNLYKVTEFQTRADIGRSGEAILRKETVKEDYPGSSIEETSVSWKPPDFLGLCCSVGCSTTSLAVKKENPMSEKNQIVVVLLVALCL